MPTKSEETSKYIIEKVAPVFNKKGYVGTSLSELEKITKLTKGAIYSNFKNKNELALKAFNHNVSNILSPLSSKINAETISFKKLFIVAKYYSNYYPKMMKIGGCPIVNVCIDAKNNNPILFDKGKIISKSLINEIKQIIEQGIEKEELKTDLNATEVAMNIYSMIEGAIFMSFTHEKPIFLKNISKHIESLINSLIKK